MVPGWGGVHPLKGKLSPSNHHGFGLTTNLKDVVLSGSAPQGLKKGHAKGLTLHPLLLPLVLSSHRSQVEVSWKVHRRTGQLGH